MKIFYLFFFILFAANFAYSSTILVEAEQFSDYGGWVLDQQFMGQMGSPYLLAHGLGVPVADAVTSVDVPAAGQYKVWVRTYDWVGRWRGTEWPVTKRAAGDAPGRFQLYINSSPLGVTFGTDGTDWCWQNGGLISFDKKTIRIALHDLTGFEGRCDAIVLTTDMSFVPPNEDNAMKLWRNSLRKTEEEISHYDFVVVGGGMAGTCAAITAARQGLTVALIHDRPVLGGNNSSEVRVHLGGQTNFAPYPLIGNVVKELDSGDSGNRKPAAAYNDMRKMSVVQNEPRITLYMNYHANETIVDSNSLIVSVIAENIQNNRRIRISGRYFADCTGDGEVGHMAGAEYEMKSAGHMGSSNLWRVIDTGTTTVFPACPWALNLYDKPFPDKELGNWFWESGFDHNTILKAEYIRDWNFRAMYGAWDTLKNKRKQYPTHKIEWAAYIAGKRESRQLLGDVILSYGDIKTGMLYPDGCVPATWDIDVHFPSPVYISGFEKDGFISNTTFDKYARPYWIPYRCLYSRNIRNLFMAGRDISVSHQALGAVRVMRTTGMMGEVTGLAASICVKNNVTPHGVYENYFPALQKLMGKTE